MNIAVILCGGRGTRMNMSLPKQFIKIDDKPLFIHTLDKFFAISEINKIVLVVEKEYLDDYVNLLKDFDCLSKVEFTFGGATRQESVDNAIEYLSFCSDLDIVLIHDGARVLVDQKIILANIDACLQNDVVSTQINVVDTVVDRDHNLFDRNELMLVQTPQTFKYGVLKDIHRLAKKDNIVNASDDIQLAKRYNYKIASANGSRINIKVTEQADLDFVKVFLEKKVI